MKKKWYIIPVLLLGLGTALPALPAAPLGPFSRAFYLGISSDAFLSLDAGFFHTLGKPKPTGIRTGVYGVVSLPLLLITSGGSFDTAAVGVGASMEFYGKGRFSLFFDLGLQTLVQNDAVGLSVPVIVSAALMPALRFDTWYCGLNAQVSAAVTTYMRHGVTVKDTFRDITDGDGDSLDSAPTDGWYGPTGFSIRGGIEFAHTPGGRLGYRIATGLVWYPSAYTEMLDAMMIGQIPFYLEAGLYYTF